MSAALFHVMANQKEMQKSGWLEQRSPEEKKSKNPLVLKSCH